MSQVNIGWKIGTITETGLPVASMTAFQTSIVRARWAPVRADFSAPPRILSDLPFLCTSSSKNQVIPPKILRPLPHPYTPIPALNAQISALGTYLIARVERPGREFEEGRC